MDYEWKKEILIWNEVQMCIQCVNNIIIIQCVHETTTPIHTEHADLFVLRSCMCACTLIAKHCVNWKYCCNLNFDENEFVYHSRGLVECRQSHNKHKHSHLSLEQLINQNKQTGAMLIFHYDHRLVLNKHIFVIWNSNEHCNRRLSSKVIVFIVWEIRLSQYVCVCQFKCVHYKLNKLIWIREKYRLRYWVKSHRKSWFYKKIIFRMQNVN